MPTRASLAVCTIIFCHFQGLGAKAQSCKNISYTVAQIAAAIKKASDAPSSVTNRSCMWGGAARAESGGNPCAHNSNNFGILQLSRQNLNNLGLNPEEYMASSLQAQVDGWVLAGAAENNKSLGFGSVDSKISQSLKLGHLMDGVLAACSQFGAAICNNDIRIVESGKALPISEADGAIRCKNASCNGGTANQDGNGNTIVSWGLQIQDRIYKSRCAD